MEAPDLSAVIAELESIKENQTSARQKTLGNAIKQIDDAAKNPSAAARAYADARRIVEFDGKPNAGQRFTEWKNKKADMLGSSGLQGAASLHLTYLSLTLKQVGEPDTEARMLESLDYVRQLGAARASNPEMDAFDETKDLLNKPLSDSVFAKSSQTSDVVSKLKDWELVAGNIEGILDKNVRRLMRKSNDPRVIDTWDLQLELEQMMAEKSGSDLRIQNFATTRRPTLLWRKANEYVTIGQPVRGLSGMIEIIRANPNHPDMPVWLETATALAKEQQKS